jgi:hypothetical protein
MAQKRVKNSSRAPKTEGYNAIDAPGTFTVCLIASLESTTAIFLGNCVATNSVGDLIHQCQELGKSVTFSHHNGRTVIDRRAEKNRSIIFILSERRGLTHKILKGIDLVYKLDETLEDFHRRIQNRRDAVRSIPARPGSACFDGPITLVPTTHVKLMMTERGFLWPVIVDVVSSNTSQQQQQIGGSVKYRKNGVEVVVAPVNYKNERSVITVYRVDADAPPLTGTGRNRKTRTCDRVEDPHELLTRVDGLIKLVQDKKPGESLEEESHVLRYLECIYSYTTDLEGPGPQDLDAVQINTRIVRCLFSVCDIEGLLHRDTAVDVLASVRSMFAAAYTLCMQSPQAYGFGTVVCNAEDVGTDVQLLQTFQRRLQHIHTFGQDMPVTYHAELTVMVRHLRAVSGSNSPAKIRKEVNEVYNFAHQVLKAVPRPVQP